MFRTRTFILTAVVFVALGTSSQAEHAKITLDVSAAEAKETAHVDQTPPAWGKNPRPVLKAKAGDPIKIQWNFTNIYPNKTLKDVVVHFYVVKVKAVGQKEAPDLSGDPVCESAFEMDFKPGAKAGQRSTLKIDQPGVYLVRVESRQTDSDHEHFSAVDLVIEGKGSK
jgi:hypothetical protein